MQVLHPLGLADWRSAVQVKMLVLLLKGECTRMNLGIYHVTYYYIRYRRL